MKKYINKFFSVLFIIISLLINLTTNIKANEKIETYSPSCLLMEINTEKILYEKNINQKMFPASTTKLMTAILVVENCQLTDTTTVSSNAISNIPEGYSTAYLREGEQLTISELLNVLLIPSANDAANVLAEHVSGSISSFVTLMNQKAKELGCKNTNFTNPSGIHDENHYSTAYDLALIGKYASQNEIISQICSSTSCHLQSINNQERFFYTSNALLLDSKETNYYYEYATGLKTGYTDKAKDCIVATATKNDVDLLVVILGADDLDNNQSQRYLDCHTLFDYGFNNYSWKVIASKNSLYKQINLWSSPNQDNSLNIIFKDDIKIFLKNDFDEKKLKKQVSLNIPLSAISAGDSLGKITYFSDDCSYSSTLIAENSVEHVISTSSNFKIFLLIFLVMVLWICLKEKNN